MGIETFIAKVIKVVNSFYGKDIDIIFLRKKRIVVQGLAIVKLESLKHKSYGFYHVIIFHIWININFQAAPHINIVIKMKLFSIKPKPKKMNPKA